MTAEVTPSGSGSIRVYGPPADGLLTVRGGVGGISFQLEELAVGAERVIGLAATLSELEVEVRRIWEDLVPFQNLPRWSGTMALDSVGESVTNLQAVRAELQRIGNQVQACKREYEVAESAAATARSMGIPNLGAEHERHADFWRTGFLSRSAVENMTAGAVSAIPLVKALVEGVLPGMRSRSVELKREETLSIDFDPSPAGLLERVRLIDERGAGFIEVIEVGHEEQKVFIVVIPGTQLGSGDAGGNPFGLSGIVEGFGSDSRNVKSAVMEALAAAGAQRGATVVGVGYSQGGIHAMNLAASEEFVANYNLKFVLTAGSPVAGIRPQPGVDTLHLEHRTDWVPGADGAPNPDARNQVTATMTNDLYVQTGENVGIGPGHQLSGYQDGARLVAASNDPSLSGSTAALGAVLRAGGAAAATRFSLTRAQAPAPNLHAADTRRQERGYGGR